MNRWCKRSSELELLDLGKTHYTEKEYEDCLFNLDQIGKWLGGDFATFSSLKKIHPKPLSFLDVGCGGGGFTRKLAQRYPQAKVVGIDLNPEAILYAKKKSKNSYENLSFKTCSLHLNEPKKSYDVVLSTLVCHHMKEEEIINFISQARAIAKQRVIINDLHRHPLAFYLFKMITPLFFRNRLIKHDGLLSICRAFKYKEWIYYLERAGVRSSEYRIRWRSMFRWLIEIQTD